MSRKTREIVGRAPMLSTLGLTWGPPRGTAQSGGANRPPKCCVRSEGLRPADWLQRLAAPPLPSPLLSGHVATGLQALRYYSPSPANEEKAFMLLWKGSCKETLRAHSSEELLGWPGRLAFLGKWLSSLTREVLVSETNRGRSPAIHCDSLEESFLPVQKREWKCGCCLIDVIHVYIHSSCKNSFVHTIEFSEMNILTYKYGL